MFPDVLIHIREVIQEVTIPTWLSSVLSNFGSASAGTIKANEWHSLITVYIPIILVSLWGADTSHPFNEVSTLLRTVLNHKMELVYIVYLVYAWTATPDKAYTYCSHIVYYVANLIKTHPTSALCPNHHTAFHIYNYLLLFGPWWCFPFKHLIGILQCLPVNHKSDGLLWNISWSDMDSFFVRQVGSYNTTFFY